MIMNGVQEIVLVPENELEKVFLDSFSKASSLQSTLISKPTPILNEVIQSGLVFSTSAPMAKTPSLAYASKDKEGELV